jgi:hypothetical protein
MTLISTGLTRKRTIPDPLTAHFGRSSGSRIIVKRGGSNEPMLKTPRCEGQKLGEKNRVAVVKFENV